MSVGNSPIVRSYTLCDHSGECVQLFEDDHEKDLGIWFTSDLNPPYDQKIFCKYFKRIIYIFVYDICKTPSGILCTYLESLSCKRHSSIRESPEAGYKVSQRLCLMNRD